MSEPMHVTPGLSGERTFPSITPDDLIPLAYFDEAFCAVSIVREDGFVLYMNETAQRLFCSVHGRPNTLVGRNVLDFEPRGLASERVTFMRSLARQEKHGVIRNIWQGEQILTSLRLLPKVPGETLRRFFAINERIAGARDAADFPDAVFLEPRNQDWGPLSKLSPREIEVLALVGEGLTAVEIAKRISRTKQTVDSHKSSLLRKLQCANAVQLAVIAHRAGLRYRSPEPVARASA